MNDYSEPINRLLAQGSPEIDLQPQDYANTGIGPEHVPELIELLSDENFDKMREEEWWSRIHAWRALAHLQAPEAVEPLLNVLGEPANADFFEYLIDELPQILSQFGPSIIPTVAAKIELYRHEEFIPARFTSTLKEIALRFPESRTEVVSILEGVMKDAANYARGFNALLIENLIALNAIEAWQAIEKAFTDNYVDEFIIGDVDSVKEELEHGPYQPDPEPTPAITRTPKEKAEKRKLQRRAKKKRKR